MVAWEPWRALRERPHITFALRTLPAGILGVYWPRGARAAIIIDPALTRTERKAVLAHELVHDERGGGADQPGMPVCWSAVVARDERQVDGEVARRLVPPADLRDFCEALVGLGYGVEVADVAERFDVPAWVAERALRLLSLRP